MWMQPMKTPGRTPARIGHMAALCALALSALAAAAAGCRAQDRSAGQKGAAAFPADSGLPAVLATVDGAPVTLADVRARASDDLDQLDLRYLQARHQIVRAALDSVLFQRVLSAEAGKQGKSVDELIAAEAGGPLAPTEVEIKAWYDANQSRLSGRMLDELRPQIASLLQQQRRAEALKKLQARLYAQHKIAVAMPPFRLAIRNAGAPTLGRDGAPITIVEFSDFQCPYCGGFAPTLKKVEQDFGDQVKVVFRQFPLSSIHQYAPKAAEASLCAQDQGKFWAMHDLMFQEQDRLSVTDLKEKAGRLGLDRKQFDSCLDTGRHVEQVQNDQKEGRRLGINGTPAVFINGVPVPGGAVPYETIAQAIQDELARVNQK